MEREVQIHGSVREFIERHPVATYLLLTFVLSWGAWHLLQMWCVGATSAGMISRTLFLSLYFLSSIAALTAFRVLTVLVYDRTGSLLVAIAMTRADNRPDRGIR